MDQIVQELLRYGWEGLVIACVLGLARLAWPGLIALFPRLLAERRAREERLLKALQQSTKAMTEGTAKDEAVQQALERLCSQQGEAVRDIRFIAEHLDIDLRKRERATASDVGRAA